MAVVRWTDEALRNLDDILAEIARENPMVAIDLVETIIASDNALKIFPARNPVRHEGGLRERPVLGTCYILLYRVAREGLVYILTIRHEARSERGL